MSKIYLCKKKHIELTWLPVKLYIEVTLRAVFHPHCDQSPSDLKTTKEDKYLQRRSKLSSVTLCLHKYSVVLEVWKQMQRGEGEGKENAERQTSAWLLSTDLSDAT